MISAVNRSAKSSRTHERSGGERLNPRLPAVRPHRPRRPDGAPRVERRHAQAPPGRRRLEVARDGQRDRVLEGRHPRARVDQDPARVPAQAARQGRPRPDVQRVQGAGQGGGRGALRDAPGPAAGGDEALVPRVELGRGGGRGDAPPLQGGGRDGVRAAAHRDHRGEGRGAEEERGGDRGGRRRRHRAPRGRDPHRDPAARAGGRRDRRRRRPRAHGGRAVCRVAAGERRLREGGECDRRVRRRPGAGAARAVRRRDVRQAHAPARQDVRLQGALHQRGVALPAAQAGQLPHGALRHARAPAAPGLHDVPAHRDAGAAPAHRHRHPLHHTTTTSL